LFHLRRVNLLDSSRKS